MFDREKFKALIHYACATVNDPTKLGAIKLNKILWFSDVFAFADLGRSVTGATYVKQKFGPVPRAMVPLLYELAREGKIRIDDVSYFGKTKKQYVPLLPADPSVFREQEKQVIDYVIRQITDHFTATEISNLTHEDIWKMAEIGEEIPLSAMLASDLGEVNDDDLDWVKDQQRAREAA